MKRELLLVFVAALALYLPAAGYGFVQDDRAIIVSNPAAHSIPAALAAFDDPYWPRGSGAGLYRPLTILSYAVDWTVSDGSPGWFHVMNALWHGLATVLLTVILMRWLPTLAAVGAGLLFAWHPVHVEAVASLVGRAELLAAVGIFGAVLAARREQWAVSVLCAVAAMLSKEHGVIAPVVILFDNWLQGSEARRLPIGFLVALGASTVGFLAAWFVIGVAGAHDAAVVFYGRSTLGRTACLARFPVVRLQPSGHSRARGILGGGGIGNRHRNRACRVDCLVASSRTCDCVHGGTRSAFVFTDRQSLVSIWSSSRGAQSLSCGGVAGGIRGHRLSVARCAPRTAACCCGARGGRRRVRDAILAATAGVA